MVITQDHWGGAQRYVFDIVTGLSEKYHWVVAIGEINQDDQQSLSNQLHTWVVQHPESTIIIEPLNHLRRAISPWHDLRARIELISLTKKYAVDITHANSSKAMAVVSSIARHIGSTLTTTHGWVSAEPLSFLRKKLYHAIEQYTAQHLDAVISPDTVGTTIAKQYGAKKTYTIPHGIAQQHFLEPSVARQQLGIPQDVAVIGAIANWYPTKNISLLVSAFAEIHQSAPHTHLVLIGDGPERPAVIDAISHHKLTDVIHTPGALPHAAQYCAAFTVGVLPSTKEGYPYALLEMAQAGIPIVASNLPGIAEILNTHENAILTTPDHKSLVLALTKALKLPCTTPAPSTHATMLAQTQQVYAQLLRQ